MNLLLGVKEQKNTQINQDDSSAKWMDLVHHRGDRVCCVGNKCVHYYIGSHRAGQLGAIDRPPRWGGLLCVIELKPPTEGRFIAGAPFDLYMCVLLVVRYIYI